VIFEPIAKEHYSVHFAILFYPLSNKLELDHPQSKDFHDLKD
jgi:hypothetical protein